MSKLKTARNVALYATGEIIPRVLSFLLLPVLTKYLSTSDYGISSYINTIATFLYVLTTLSVNSYALRTYYKAGSESGKKKLLGNIFVFLCSWGLIMLLLEALLFPVLLNAFSVQVPFYPYFLLGLIINFFDVTSIIPLITYRVNEDAKGFVLLSVGRTVLQYAFILLLIVYFKMGLLGSFLGRLITCVPFFIIYVLVVKKRGIFTIDIQQIKEALRFSLPLLPGALSYLVISMFDRVILERYVSMSALGIYSVAFTLSLTLNIVIQGLYRSFEQKIFREHNSHDYLQKVDALYKIYIAALYIPALCVILFSKEILMFFTSKQYFGAAGYVPYLVVAVIISGMNTFMGTLLIADDKRKVISYSSFTAAILSLIINLVFIKYFGVTGACFASILSFLIVSVFYFTKTAMQKKYIVQQICFLLIFLLIKYIVQTDVSLIMEIAIKLLLLIVFAVLVKLTICLKLPPVSALKTLKRLKQYNLLMQVFILIAIFK
ncbi:lipopolysaccharide biosynthesis protein [Parafilimonas sp.]|uniref:lipopolysaccharide biosynthesis protein n=1 Tax=Parafilimonas sp. TaxID=1969739 RepID=UPI0039E5DB55